LGKRIADGRALATVSPTTASVLDGTDDLSDWDDEEIRRGQRRNRKGGFSGRPPKLVPQRLHAERHRRTLTRAHELFTANTEKAVQVLVDIATDATAPHSDRVKAASLILDRVLGRAPQAIEVAMREPKFLSVIRAATIVYDGSDPDEDADVIDAEVLLD
jgi:hypothetical protein